MEKLDMGLYKILLILLACSSRSILKEILAKQDFLQTKDDLAG